MMRPYGTDDGHAVSQARHCRHRSRCESSRSVGSTLPSTTLRIRCSRPRGDSSSWPVAMYVGQAGRQKPQWMQFWRSLSAGASGPKNPLARGTSGDAAALTAPAPSVPG